MARLKSIQAGSFDLVWADPPYELVPVFLDTAAASIPGIIAAGGIFALESGVESRELANSWSEKTGLKLIKQRDYGVTLITIWQKN
jgi:16S rRNA G966 N2-methylase RsmD